MVYMGFSTRPPEMGYHHLIAIILLLVATHNKYPTIKCNYVANVGLDIIHGQRRPRTVSVV